MTIGDLKEAMADLGDSCDVEVIDSISGLVFRGAQIQVESNFEPGEGGWLTISYDADAKAEDEQ
jgi:hypothetical protein